MFTSGDANQSCSTNVQHGCSPYDSAQHDTISCPMDTSECGNANDYSNLSNIKVTVGIDEDLQMILEMDPSIVDLGVDVIGCTPATISPNLTPKSYGLPPILGG